MRGGNIKVVRDKARYSENARPNYSPIIGSGSAGVIAPASASAGAITRNTHSGSITSIKLLSGSIYLDISKYAIGSSNTFGTDYTNYVGIGSDFVENGSNIITNNTVSGSFSKGTFGEMKIESGTFFTNRGKNMYVGSNATVD
jgi:succinyl-CoA synthetase alpha subunit